MQKKTKMVTMIACFLVCTISIITAIGTTLAFYSGGGDLKNNLGTKESSVYLEEEFNPNDKWLPGETKQKKVNFGNDGESSQVIRFKVILEWLNKDGDKWTPTPPSDPDIELATINWNSQFATDWEDSFFDDDGWYYYKQVLPSGVKTAVVMDSVTFLEDLSNTVGGEYPEDFSDTTYRIKVVMEGVDVNTTLTKAEWGKTFTESGGTLTWSDS